MIPQFPEFKKLELGDKKDVEKFTSEFPPYSDFNFYSMWSWDFDQTMKISQLNGNLVVIFNDYVSREHFVSFIGDKSILDTSTKLISFSEKKYKKNFLKLIPEEIILNYKGSNFITKTDRDACDYIYLSEHLTKMDKWTKNSCGRRIRKFIKINTNYSAKALSPEDISPNEYEELYETWSRNKNIRGIFEQHEFKAFERFLKIKDKNVKYISVYIGGKLAGFSVYEVLSKNYALAHFSKADKDNYPGIFDILNWEEAKFFHNMGIKFLNWEQDLGIPGLRYSKEKYKPSFLMKQFTISKNS